MLSRRWRTTVVARRWGVYANRAGEAPYAIGAGLSKSIEIIRRRRRGVPTTGTRQQMAWEWELRATCQTSVRYAALGDSMLSWSAADGAPTGAADYFFGAAC